jgi:hypothetical protein
LRGTGSGVTPPLAVLVSSPVDNNINVWPGSAIVQGTFYLNTAVETISITANLDANPRIDVVVLQKDFVLQTVRIAILQGATAVSPTRPSLTQVDGVRWEIPLADIAVASGFVTIVTANILSYPAAANSPDAQILYNILNNSGVELISGDIVVWDSAADRAIGVTTTVNHPLITGIWDGLTANGQYGRVLSRGIGYVKVVSAVTRGQYLTTSVTSKAALGAAYSFNHVGIALESIGGPGYVLAMINPNGMRRYSGARITHSVDQSIASSTGFIYAGLLYDTEYWDTDSYHENVIQPTRLTVPAVGKYAFHASYGFAANATGARSIALRVNASTLVARSVSGGSYGDTYAVIPLNAGDYVEVGLQQNSGAPLNVLAVPDHTLIFAVDVIG